MILPLFLTLLSSLLGAFLCCRWSTLPVFLRLLLSALFVFLIVSSLIGH